jgi:hypothetical protein
MDGQTDCYRSVVARLPGRAHPACVGGIGMRSWPVEVTRVDEAIGIYEEEVTGTCRGKQALK